MAVCQAGECRLIENVQERVVCVYMYLAEFVVSVYRLLRPGIDVGKEKANTKLQLHPAFVVFFPEELRLLYSHAEDPSRGN